MAYWQIYDLIFKMTTHINLSFAIFHLSIFFNANHPLYLFALWVWLLWRGMLPTGRINISLGQHISRHMMHLSDCVWKTWILRANKNTPFCLLPHLFFASMLSAEKMDCHKFYQFYTLKMIAAEVLHGPLYYWPKLEAVCSFNGSAFLTWNLAQKKCARTPRTNWPRWHS